MPARKNTTTKAASGQLVGYARVSTRQQDLALQLDALNQATRSSSGALTGSAAACATSST